MKFNKRQFEKDELFQLFFKILIEPDILFYDKLPSYASHFYPSYGDWETDRLRYSLLDYSKHCSLDLTFNALAYMQDSKNQELANERINSIIDIAPNIYNTFNIKEIGYRKKTVIFFREIDKQKLIKEFFMKFYHPNKILHTYETVNIKDFSYIVDFTRDGLNINTVIGPVQGRETLRFVEPNYRHHFRLDEIEKYQLEYIKNLPEIGLLVDINTFQTFENSNKTNISEVYSNLKNESEELFKNIHNMIFEV